MKKLLAWFLAAVMSISLVACSSHNDVVSEEMIQEYESRISELERLVLEQKSTIEEQTQLIAQYEEIINTSSSTETDNENMDTSNKNTETNNESTDTEVVEPQYEVVEITLDNWKDFFELREYHEFELNGFGEFDKVTTYYALVSKDGIIFDKSKSDVTFEFTCTIESKPYTVDFENRSVIYGETTKTTISEPEVETMGNVGQYIGEDSRNRYGRYLGVCNFISKLEGEAREVVSIEITRIAGNFCVAREN